ncbi:MAG: 30S ribosomal protein S8 [Chlamydiae bacterium]|nr:30S ribosomal protein S8 [Chlamydiota bacterium]
MSVSDPIADLLTRIRNGARAKHRYIDARYTKMKGRVVRILQDRGFVDKVLIDEEKGRMRIFLKYDGRDPLVGQLVRVSSPGLRRYVGYRDIPRIDGGMGLVVLSTPLGVMDGELAREKKVGGELLCLVR